MKHLLILLFLLCTAALKTFSQENPIPDGYKLNPSQNIIYAYRNVEDKPDLSIRNRWNHKYWFEFDSTTEKYTDSVSKEKYIRITIISKRRYDDKKKRWVNELGYNMIVPWKNEELIDGSDFNTWLWIRETDFNKLKTNYYSKIKVSFILSAFTVPFKYRPAVGGQTNSLINGDINLGSFIGLRIAKGENFGLSLGGHFSVTSISLNASNNTSLAGNSTETIQGFSYGFGTIVDLKKKIQLGLVVGYDYGLGNLADTYVYQQKDWVSFSLNYKFLDFGILEKQHGN